MNRTSILFLVIALLCIAGAFLLFRSSDRPALPPLEINISYSGNPQFEPQVYRAEEGQEISINIISTVEDVIHLHGYDVRTQASANQAASLKFTAAETGRFDFELENKQIKLGILEVYPK